MKKKLKNDDSGFKRSVQKILLVMKLTILLTVVMTLAVSAGTYSQNTKLDLSLQNATIEQALLEIENHSRFVFIYESGTIDKSLKRTISVKESTIDAILTQLLQGTDIGYSVDDRQVLLYKKDDRLNSLYSLSSSNQQQSRTVTGRVTDSSGAPLPGVTIVIKGTTSGSITDAEGVYTLVNVPGDVVLQFSFVGMKTQEMNVSGRSTIHVTMLEETVGIEEVVAIGYGTSSKKKLSTAISSMKTEEIAEIPIANVGDALSGRIAGVIADNGDGNPGGKPVIRIRGYGSIYAGSEPLYVIDGMLASSDQFATLNPKSIEKIDILKDAAAGAIYGSRAGNGVIIVTTKSGTAGAAQIAFNTTMGVQQLERKVDVLNRDEWLSYAKEAYANDHLAIPEFYLRDPSSYANTDWQDEIYRPALYQNHQLAVSGGTDKVKYYLSANYLGNEGILKTTYNNSLSTNGNFEINVRPNLQVGTTFNITGIKQRTNQSIMGFGHLGNGYGVAGGIIQQSLWLPPIIPVYTDTGDYGQLMQGEFAPPYFTQGYANPVSGLNEIYDVYTNNNVMSRTFFSYEPVKGLSLHASYTWTLYSRFREYHTSPYLGGNGSPYANFSNPKYDKMTAGQENYSGSSWIADFYADYEKVLNDVHRVKVTFGGSFQENNGRSTTAASSVNDRGTTNALSPIPAFDNYFRPNIYGAALILGGGSYGQSKFESVFGRLNYDFKDKYILMASIRRDGSSKFAPNGRFGVFPAVSGAWRITQESFMKDIPFIDELKLRASYGLLGNDQFGDFEWNGTVTYSDIYTYGPTSGGGAGAAKVLMPSSIENQNLKWEVNEQTNFGVDFSGLENRVNLTLDYFVRNTKDMLLYRDLPLENGIATRIFDNLGNMTNKGLEVTLNTINLKTKDLQWRTTFNFSKVRNKVQSVFTSSGYVSMGWNGMIRIMENRPMFEIYGYKVTGNYTSAEQLTTVPGLNNPRVGDPMLEDYKADHVINGDDWQPLGHALPDYLYGFQTSLRYKNFELQVVIDGSHGASKVVSALRQATLLYYGSNVFKPYYDERYIEGVQSGSGVAFPSKSVTGPRHMETSRLVYDASYTRIKNLMLSYNVPQRICQAVKIDDVKLTLGVQNLYTFTDYPLYNPQANTARGAAGNAQFGWDEGVYPLARTYTLGLNFTF